MRGPSLGQGDRMPFSVEILSPVGPRKPRPIAAVAARAQILGQRIAGFRRDRRNRASLAAASQDQHTAQTKYHFTTENTENTEKRQRKQRA